MIEITPEVIALRKHEILESMQWLTAVGLTPDEAKAYIVSALDPSDPRMSEAETGLSLPIVVEAFVEFDMVTSQPPTVVRMYVDALASLIRLMGDLGYTSQQAVLGLLAAHRAGLRALIDIDPTLAVEVADGAREPIASALAILAGEAPGSPVVRPTSKAR
jgi:hypothetical protein